MVAGATVHPAGVKGTLRDAATVGAGYAVREPQDAENRQDLKSLFKAGFRATGGADRRTLHEFMLYYDI